MTLKERIQKANEEYQLLTKWANEESEKVSAQLKAKGMLIGLDTNREAYAPIHDEYQKRFLALYDKYDLPNKPTL